MQSLLKKAPWGFLLLLLALAGFWGAWRIDASIAGDSGLAVLEAYPWIYQRPGAQTEAGESYDVILVGDILAGRGGVQPDLLEIPAAFAQADLLVGNLEGVIADLPVAVEPERQAYHLAGPAQAGPALRRLGFDLLGLANNHALDLGPEGLRETTSNLDRAGIAWVGAGEEAAQASQAWFWQAGTLRLAILAVNAVPSPLLETANSGWRPAEWGPDFLSSVQAASERADLVIVLVHWGYEYQRPVDPAQERLAQSLLEAGADLVIGSHPHVAQEVQVIPGARRSDPQIVAYSLGNFIFDQGGADDTDGLALRVVLDGEGMRGAQLLPVQSGLRPALASPEAARALMDWLGQTPSPAVFGCDEQTCRPIEQPDLTGRVVTGGLFWSGQSDLTGDQEVELVRREAGQVIVYQAGLEVWRTPPEWQILDAALGDPDWDGRDDITLAMLKPDGGGVLRSHPFIMGYRGGIYRNLWGGSAVSDPILEIEVGHVDRTAQPELIVLEERDSGLEAVTVWDWHGWGFSLRWRSLEADYENLRLALDPAGGPAWIVVDRR